MSDTTPPIERAARDEYREGVSAGAAARQLCRTLGISGQYPTLKRMLEDMLADANRAAADRGRILQAFAEADPEAAATAKTESFRRMNRLDEAEPARH